jgi:outer membrane lipoprotein-sorting protein
LKNLRISYLIASFTLVLAALLAAHVYAADTPKPTAPAAPTLRSVDKTDLKSLALLNTRYQSAASVDMDVEKTLKLGLLGQERKSKGHVWLSKGRIRMELEGAEKTLLVVNKKHLWAVTFPPAEFKQAVIQVITGDVDSKAAHKQAMAGLLGAGGFLKNFTATGVQIQANGEHDYFMQPQHDQNEMKRAMLRVSPDGQKILSISYWDERDNETGFQFGEPAFSKKVDTKENDKRYNYTPPANADVMKL